MEITRSQIKNQNEIVNQLKRASEDNTLLLMVLKKFTTRVRNRSVLTPAALKLAMTKDGLNFPKSHYSAILKLFASLGIGKLDLGPRGQVRALNRIPVDLKALGEMVSGTRPVPAAEAPFSSIIAPELPSNDIDGFKLRYSAHLIVNIKGQPVQFGGVTSLDTEDLGDFLIRFTELCRKYSK